MEPELDGPFLEGAKNLEPIKKGTGSLTLLY